MKVSLSLVLVIFFGFGESLCFDPRKHRNWNLLPHEECGEVSSARIIGGEEAEMNAYPWLVRIGFYGDGGIIFHCGGAIINSWTVLTAAHCVKGYSVEVVRVGEHDLLTNPDCNEYFCADPIVDIEPAEIIYHENYDKPRLKNDIGLIRLKNKIHFTDFVKPICLSPRKLFTSALIGEKGEVAGWGIYDIDDMKASRTLLTIQLPILANSVCRPFLPDYVYIYDTQLCVGGTIGRDSCGGDSGGPLMKVFNSEYGPRYYLLGLVSFGAKKCGKTKMPGIYTKMDSYMEWLLNNI